MKKLIKGIVDFREKRLPDWRETFARLALGQSPDSLFIGCSDSRVVPNVFASTEPGDLFVVRNVGNLIPPCGSRGVSVSDESEAAAIEFALLNLKVSHVIVCGHSECGAMQAICGGRAKVDAPHLRSWLRHGQASMESIRNGAPMCPELATHNQLSQYNVLQQLEHLKTYPFIRERVESGQLRLWGMWFDIQNADVYFYEQTAGKFVLIDREECERILSRI